ncbi:MAG: glycosyltransferase family 2 protein [Alphaproteobacteria bacterium]|nr:glycosyltransferase family 2 protein [Alphaproteobacteria bacterium]
MLSACDETALVAILLCTFNGEKFLQEQLESLSAQTHARWVLHASDDGSTDQTWQILEAYQKARPSGQVHLYKGPQKGFSFHFMDLVNCISMPAPYYAFCDQDDVWKSKKLEIALRTLQATRNEGPSLYCGRTELIDEKGSPMGLSPLFSRPPSFSNALVQSLAGGNTMVFNEQACRLLRHIGSNTSIVSHDWLLYQLVTGCQGAVFYDEMPQVFYRQHQKNLVGANNTVMARLKRIKLLINGRFYHWNSANTKVLQFSSILFTPMNLEILNNFDNGRRSALLKRLYLFNKAGIYRQTLLGNVALFVAAILGKL